MIATISSIGLLLTTVGAALLFFYGLPARVPSQGVVLAWGGPSAADIATDESYRWRGYWGFALTIVGSMLQFLATWV